jgi:predicted enzyme related to lactoylglutathione lyase
MPVTGIGGVFFRARDPKALAAWYLEHLGVGGKYGKWAQSAGTTVFSPFAETTDYFPAEKQWMLNLRVEGLDELIAKLEAAGIAIERRKEWDEGGFGRFARIHDPEGNAVELWEPA